MPPSPTMPPRGPRAKRTRGTRKPWRPAATHAHSRSPVRSCKSRCFWRPSCSGCALLERRLASEIGDLGKRQTSPTEGAQGTSATMLEINGHLAAFDAMERGPADEAALHDWRTSAEPRAWLFAAAALARLNRPPEARAQLARVLDHAETTGALLS